MIPFNTPIPQDIWYKIAAIILWKTCPTGQISLTLEDVEKFSQLHADKGGPAIASETQNDCLTFRILPNAVARDLAKAMGAFYVSPKD